MIFLNAETALFLSCQQSITPFALQKVETQVRSHESILRWTTVPEVCNNGTVLRQNCT